MPLGNGNGKGMNGICDVGQASFLHGICVWHAFTDSYVYIYVVMCPRNEENKQGFYLDKHHTIPYHTMAAPAYGLLFLLLLLPLLFSVCQEQQQQQQTLAVAAETALNDPWKHDGTHEEAAEERYAKSYRHGYDDDDEEEDEKQQYHAPPARHIHRDDDGKRSHGGRSRQSEHRFVLDIDDDDDDDDRSSLIHTTVFSTEAGELKFLSPRINCDDDDNQNNQELARERIGLSFLTLEPNALLLPQYTHSDCLFVVIKGSI